MPEGDAGGWPTYPTGHGLVFHYQPVIDQMSDKNWKHYSFDLDELIDDAIVAAEKKGFVFNKALLRLCQAEMLIELVNASAELTIGGFDLKYR